MVIGTSELTGSANESTDGKLYRLNDFRLGARIEDREANGPEPNTQTLEGIAGSLTRSAASAMRRSSQHNPRMLLDFGCW